MENFMLWLYFVLTILLITQGLFTINWMLYAWNNPKNIKKFSSPEKLLEPLLSFSALVPARHEVEVLKDTVRAINSIRYPNHLKEILIICRNDDEETIGEAINALKEEINSEIRLIVFSGLPINKPHGLNHALQEARNDIITIFDAEDEPHQNIYNVINTIYATEDVDVIQAGVQLMNYRTNWFSTLNVLEYYFWFKSGLQYFYNVGGVTPLGGNTVFFKRQDLIDIRGWDDACLTEDADLGIRLSVNGSKFRILYDERYVTKEETPYKVEEFIKQRTRWLQGFIQILIKGDWIKLRGVRRKIFALYILSSTLTLSFLVSFYIPLGIILIFSYDMPLWLSLISYVPLQLMIIQVFIQVIGLFEFTKSYNMKFYPWLPFKVFITFYPYVTMLTISSIRAIYREILSVSSWEKTSHNNLHREINSSKLY